MSYVRDVLTHRIPVDLDPNQRHVLDVLSQQWGDVDRRTELTEGFVALLRDPEPELRAAAVQFFVAHMADDGGALYDAYENHLDQYEDLSRHWYPGEGDLRDLLVLAIAKRALPGSREVELLKAEALRPGHGGYATLGLLATEPAWLRQHLIEIIQDSPGALPGLLLNLGVLDVAPDPLIVQLKGQVPDEVLFKAIQTAVPKDRERLAALVGNASQQEPAPAPQSAGLDATSAVERQESARIASGSPGLVREIAALRNKPLQGGGDISGIAPSEMTDCEAERHTRRAIREACLDSLVAIAETDQGLSALIQAAAAETSLGVRNHLTLALRRADPERLSRALQVGFGAPGQASLTALRAAEAIATDFWLSMEAVARYLDHEPRLPPALSLFHDVARDDLHRLARGDEPAASLAASVLDVVARYT